MARAGDRGAARRRRLALDGTKVHVADGAAADLLLVDRARRPTARSACSRCSGDDAASRSSRPRRSTAPARRRRVDVRRRRRAGGSAPATRRDAVARTLDRLAVAYVVDGVGAAQRALELAVEYAKERVQFDKPIGSFQAVQHLCADMLRTVELGRAAGYYACWAADDADPTEAHRAATMAKAFAGDAFAQLGGSAIQVFGGIGFTWEHDIHLYYKRLLTLSRRARHRRRPPRRARHHRHRLTRATASGARAAIRHQKSQMRAPCARSLPSEARTRFASAVPRTVAATTRARAIPARR